MRELLRTVYLNILGSISSFKPGIHLLNSHYISPSILDHQIDSEVYERFLSFLSKRSTFINLEDATSRIFENKIPTDEVFIAFTFDDGFEDCYTIIAPLLEKYNCRGTFFINANYISSNQTYQNEFNERTKTFTKKPMTWEQVKDLHNRGHLIGAHTLDHMDLSILTESDIEYQLSENKRILEDQLNYNCEYFAWTYGRLQNFSPRILETAKKYYLYIYSATDYKQYFSFNGQVVNRRHIEAFWPKSHIRYFLSFKKLFNK